MNSAFTTRAAKAVSQGYTLYTSLDLLQSGNVVAPDIPMGDDASVSVDGTAAIRRTFSMSVPNPTAYLPLTAESLLSPFLTEIRVWAGIQFIDGTIDKWAIFTGGIQAPEISDTDNDLTIRLTASDRAQGISERRLSLPYAIASGTNLITAIKGLIQYVAPATQFVTPTTTGITTPDLQIDELEDPWQHAQDLASASGFEVFFNGMGVCIIQPVVDPDTAAVVWTFVEGAAAMAKSVDLQLTSTESYSHAIVTGATLDGSTAPIRSDYYDLDTTSATYYDPSLPMASRFGDKPVKLASDLITTQGQADQAAYALLIRKRGAIENVKFGTAPITALDEFDVVVLQRARLGLDAAFTLRSFEIPLFESGEMNPTCRSRRV